MDSSRRRKSPVWDYFTKNGDKILCTLCSIQLANGGGTSNLINHLKSKHVEEARKCFVGSTEKVDVKKQTTMAAFVDLRRCSADRAGQITNLIAQFITRDLRPAL